MLHRFDSVETAVATLVTTTTLGGPYVLQLARMAYAQSVGAAGDIADIAPLSLEQVLGSGPLVGALILIYLLAGKVQQAIESLTKWQPKVEIVHRYPQRRRSNPDDGDDEITGVRHIKTEEREKQP
jgi:hypothetical protein